MNRSRTLRVIAVIGLLSAALFALLPWLRCGWSPVKQMLDIDMARFCTVGFPGEHTPFEPVYGPPGFNGPYWGYLVVGIAYLVAAVYVAISKRF